MAIQQPTIQLPFTTSHAFLIGINDYQYVSPLSTAVNDANKIAEQLATQHHFQVYPPLLNATFEDIRKLLSETIPKLVGEDDRVLFYFAGHGIALDGEEGPNGYLVAADTKPGQENTLIAMQVLHDALTTLPCRHGLLILDCCFSGAFKWSSGFRDVIFDMPKVIYEERFWRYCKDPAWQVITSAAHDQKAVDIITNQSLGLREEAVGDHSPFAHSLMQALDGAGDVIPPGSGDGIITATELYSYLRDTVETNTTENAKRQSPSIFNLQRHDKGEFIFLHPNHRFNLPPTPDRNPFMGLSSYNEADANLFYGRDRVVERLLAKVKKQPLTVVSGASGTGKSSVIKAGLLPQLRQQDYTILPIIRPGKEPMQTIATELPDIEEQLKEGKNVLVIDQYEELITQCLHKEDRMAFEQQIADWLNQYPDLRILLSIRSDFEPQFESEVLAQWWIAGRYVVPTFSLEEIREVITKPAAQAVLFYEPEDLVEQLSEEVSQAPGALPLLSFTLSELYHKYLKSGREDRGLTEEDYNELGGVVGALRTRADAEYQALAPAEQSSMRKLMLRMVSLEGGELAGKRVYSEELQFKDSNETQRLQTIANQLVDARLLLKGTDGQGRSYVEPAHDALVRAWARLWEWIKTVGEEKITLQYKLSQAVNDYHGLLQQDDKKARNLLWDNNPRLDLLSAELSGKNHGLNAREEAFVSDSVRRRTRRKRTNWSIAISVMVGLAILAFVANAQRQVAQENAQIAAEREIEVRDSAKVAAQQRSRANEEAIKAIANGLASQSAFVSLTDPTVAFRLAEAGLDLLPNSLQAKEALLAAFYANIANGSAGLFYEQVQDMPYKQSFDKRLNQSYNGQGTLPPDPWDDGHEFYFRRAELLQSFTSPKKRFYLAANMEHPVPYYLELADTREGKWSIRKYPDSEVLFAPASFDPEESCLIIPNANVLEFCSTTDINKVLYQLKAPTAIQQAYFADRGQKVYAQTYDNRYFSWNLNAFPIPTMNLGHFWPDDLYLTSDENTMVLSSYSEIQIWERKAQEWKLRGSSEDGRANLSTDKKTVDQDGYSTLSLASLKKYSLHDYYWENKVNTIPDQSLYQTEIPDNRRSVKLTHLQDGKQVQLLGHVFPVESVSISADGKTILTSSMEEVKLWDWQGDNFLSLDQGGIAGFFADGQSFFVYGNIPNDLADIEDDFEKILEVFSIDISTIRQWAKKQNIHQLTAAERIKYGLD